MRNKFLFVILGIMAVAFVYLKVKQVMFNDKNSITPPAPLTSDAAVRSPTETSDLRGESLIELSTLRVGNTTVAVELADTPEKRAQGLSGRELLNELHGMLFKMEESSRHAFWMKDMKFALDIIWINQGVIVDISENVPAPAGGEAPVIVQSKAPADTVLEVNAGFTQRHGIKIGDTVALDGV